MSLFGELLLAQFVQNIEFLAETIDELVTDWGQLHFYDDLSIRHHHSNTSEENLQVFR